METFVYRLLDKYYQSTSNFNKAVWKCLIFLDTQYKDKDYDRYYLAIDLILGDELTDDDVEYFIGKMKKSNLEQVT